jgi:glutamine phosphoribosylpyrophosphate amidotransferase
LLLYARESGQTLAEAFKKTGLEVDAVTPVPESARAAVTMAEVLDVPYREGFVNNATRITATDSTIGKRNACFWSVGAPGCSA